tara:strand:- start:370 stop:819 length:450 start_codon:yes stop_codon:yes gene_type:complete
MFKSFFKNKAIEGESILKDEKTLSIACLLVEAAMVDESFGEDEKKVISKILMKNFDIVDEKRLKDIIDEAVENFKEAPDLITYTKKIKDHWSLSERVEVVEMLWKVCLIDGVLEPYEDMLIRRVSGLIYVDDKNRKLAKSNAIKKLKNY